MRKTAHLTNQEIIAYTGRNNYRLTEETLNKIRKHLEEPCESCNKKIESLKRFTHSFHILTASSEMPENIYTCPYMERIEAFSSGETGDTDKNRIIHHLATCDDCREYLAVLTEQKKLAEETMDIGDDACGFWFNVRDGIARLADHLNLTFTPGQAFTPAYSAIVYRGEATGIEPENTDPISVDLVLPNELGTIRLLRVILKNGMNKISVKPLEAAEKMKLVEILDNRGNLLKSVGYQVRGV